MIKSDSQAYLAKKQRIAQLLTIYGRKPVLEALQTPSLNAERLHLAQSNKPANILNDIIALAEQRGADIVYHTREALSRISKNSKQDQGTALDIRPKGFQEFDASTLNTKDQNAPREFIALDRITNPQNLGMIIRSVCASSIAGLILPRKGCAKLDSLVIKASTGTLFKTPVFRCDELTPALMQAKDQGCAIVGLDLRASGRLSELHNTSDTIYVLGNESEGISKAVQQCCTETVRIPMHNGVESLNVAITASLIALRHQL